MDFQQQLWRLNSKLKFFPSWFEFNEAQMEDSWEMFFLFWLDELKIVKTFLRFRSISYPIIDRHFFLWISQLFIPPQIAFNISSLPTLTKNWTIFSGIFQCASANGTFLSSAQMMQFVLEGKTTSESEGKVSCALETLKIRCFFKDFIAEVS